MDSSAAGKGMAKVPEGLLKPDDPFCPKPISMSLQHFRCSCFSDVLLAQLISYREEE